MFSQTYGFCKVNIFRISIEINHQSSTFYNSNHEIYCQLKFMSGFKSEFLTCKCYHLLLQISGIADSKSTCRYCEDLELNISTINFWKA